MIIIMMYIMLMHDVRKLTTGTRFTKKQRENIEYGPLREERDGDGDPKRERKLRGGEGGRKNKRCEGRGRKGHRKKKKSYQLSPYKGKLAHAACPSFHLKEWSKKISKKIKGNGLCREGKSGTKVVVMKAS